MNVDESNSEDLKLNSATSARLADTLPTGPGTSSDGQNASEWADEMVRRDRAWDQHKSTGRSAPAVFRDARHRLDEKRAGQDMEEVTRNGMSARDMQGYAWDYFELHANQRMSLFKFFITLAVFMATSLGASLVQELYAIGSLLGALLMVVSFVFGKLDERVRSLLKNSEFALKSLEGSFLASSAPQPSELQLFRFEEVTTKKQQEGKRSKLRFWRMYLSYRQCFNILFWLFGLIGLLGTTVSAMMAFGTISELR